MIKDGGSPMSEGIKADPVKLAVLIAFVLLIVVGAVRLLQTNDAPQNSVKNRVPVQMISGQDLVNLQQQVKDQQAQIDQLKAQQPAPTPKSAYSCAEPDVKCGPNEKSNPGIISDFGSYDLLVDSQSSDFYIGFNFTDRTGFTKRFYPVCPGQTIKTGVPITLLYHWRNWTENATSKRGCFVIDGSQLN